MKKFLTHFVASIVGYVVSITFNAWLIMLGLGYALPNLGISYVQSLGFAVAANAVGALIAYAFHEDKAARKVTR